MKRDKTQSLINKAILYNIDKKYDKKSKQSTGYINSYIIKKCLGLEERKVFLGGKKVKVWAFTNDCEYSRGEISATRIASLLIKYRRALKSLGAVHKKFISSLEEAKKELLKVGVEQKVVDSLHPNLKIKTLEERILLLKRKYPKGSTSKNGMMIRQILNSIKMYHPVYYSLAGAVSFVKSITNEQQKIRLKAKHDEKIKVNPTFLINKARSVLENEKSNWSSLVVALCAVTGRRPTEIMKTAKFSIDNHTPENYIKFRGLLKSRDRKYDDDYGEWDIPIFDDAQVIIRAIRRMRRKLRKKEQQSLDTINTGDISDITETANKEYAEYITETKDTEDVTNSEYITETKDTEDVTNSEYITETKDTEDVTNSEYITETKDTEDVTNSEDAEDSIDYSAGGYLRYINQKGEEVTASIFDPTLVDDVDHNTAINHKYNVTLNNELRKWFESGDIEIKSLRAIYTKMVWEREKDTSSETYDSMTTRVLCYSKDNLSEAVKHYAAIELSDKVDKIETTSGVNKMYIPCETLIKKMEEADSIIEKRSLRAPALKRIHQWLKDKVRTGLSVEELKPSYIRRHCRVHGKRINDKTASLYLELIGIIDKKK